MGDFNPQLESESESSFLLIKSRDYLYRYDSIMLNPFLIHFRFQNNLYIFLHVAAAKNIFPTLWDIFNPPSISQCSQPKKAVGSARHCMRH